MQTYQVTVNNRRTNQTVTLYRQASSYEQAREDAVFTMFRWGRDTCTCDPWNSCECAGPGEMTEAACEAG